MRTAIIFVLVLSFITLAVGTAIAADDSSTSVITVKNSYKNNGGIAVQITKDSKDFVLSCNESMPSCKDLKKGKYRMEVLPKNHGVYECTDVRVYAESASADDAELGEYCLDAQ